MMNFHVIPEADVHRAFQRARQDLYDLGLLDAGAYLDRIGCERALLPTLHNTLGYNFDHGTEWWHRFAGFRHGVIYIPLNAPVAPHAHGATLLDTIRHEFAHAWFGLDGEFFARRWFRRAFGAHYDEVWSAAPTFDRDEFVSDYACTAPAEDFAETLMAFLRYRRSLHRFDARAGVQRKIRAVQQAVDLAARQRVPLFREPRT